jgi:hypothetical protein
MRLGLIGLGRIGAFHTNTLVGIPAIDSLTVTDIVPEKTKTNVERFGGQGVEGVDSLDALLGSGIDGVIIAAGTGMHTPCGRQSNSAPSAPLMGRFQPAFRAEVADGLEADWITEARSQKEHRPVRIEEVEIS